MCTTIYKKSFSVCQFVMLLSGATSFIYTKQNLVRYNDPSITRFPSQSSTDVIEEARQIVVSNDTVYIGATDQIFGVSLDLTKKKMSMTLKPTQVQLDKCKSDNNNNKKECRNYMTELLLTGNDDIIQACGTFARNPKCWSFNSELEENKTLETLPEKYYPSNFDSTVTTIKFNDSVFIGCKSLAKSYHSDDVRSSSNQLTDPRFVSSYKLDESGYVYFLLTEISDIKNRKYMFSRIARVCRYEEGHVYISREMFLTFLKAQLSCQKSGGSIPVYYDELQASVKLTINGEQYIYGVFSTSSEAGAPSAVCRYRVKDILNIFSKSDLADVTDSGNKAKFSPFHQKYARADCKPDFEDVFTAKEVIDQASSITGKTLLFQTIKPLDNGALFTTGSRLTSIAIDIVEIEGRSNIMMFLGGMDGLVSKVLYDTRVNKSRVVDYIEPFNSQTQIYDLKLNKGVIYAGGASGVASFPVHRCGSYMMCKDCNAVNDPYCVWDETVCREGYQAKPPKCPPAPSGFSCSIDLVNRVTLRCRLISNSVTDQKIITWTHNAKEITNGDLYVITNNGKESMLAVTIMANIAGEYQCVVGSNLHKKSCNYTLASTTTTTTPTTVETSTAYNPKNCTTDKDSGTTAPAGPDKVPAKSGDKRKTYFDEFLVTLIFLVIVLIILLAVLLLMIRKKREEKQNDSEKQVKKNGLTPTKNAMYKNKGKEQALLLAADGVAGGGGYAEKESPTIKPPEVTFLNGKEDDVEKGGAES